MKLNITIPCYNEEKILNNSINTLFKFLNENINEKEWNIIIVDNNSTDNTKKISKQLTEKFNRVKYIFTEKKGKGIAIKTGWKKFDADIYIFMDADLSTDLSSLPDLISGIKKEGYDMVVGSRFHENSNVKRTPLRKLISYSYRLIKKILTKSTVTDAPCGFKSTNKEIVKKVLPHIQDNEWFFDSELLIVTENKGYKIKEIPVKWEDIRESGDSSRVQVLSLSIKYFLSLIKLRKRI
jgi:glycosyltransferase involved in cell wall biosynthesis